MKKLFLLVLLFMTHTCFGTSITLPDWETFGRTSPLIVVAEIKAPILYEIIDEWSYRSVRTYTIIRVEKNILSDLDLNMGDPIDVHIVHDDAYEHGGKTSDEIIQRLRSSTHQERMQNIPEILCLTLNRNGHWCISPPLLHLNAKSKLEELKSQGLLRPVGIDGDETRYTLKEWQAIADAGISMHYYSLEYARPRPPHWPNTFEEAVAITVGEMRQRQRYPLFPSDYYKDIYALLGLALYDTKADNDLPRNKTLLRNMGRMDPREARRVITQKAEEVLASELHRFSPRTFGRQKIETFEFMDAPLDEAISYLFEQSDLATPYTIQFHPDTVHTKLNLRLRNLEAHRCLQFVLQQTNCAIDVSLANSPLIFYVRKEH